MRRIDVKRLSVDAFAPYGIYVQTINPKACKIGEEPIEFFRDMAPVSLGGAGQASISVCRVGKRPPIIDVTEYHSKCAEGNLPIDGDVVMHVGPATPPGEVPLDRIEAFLVPRGTFVTLRPGVWHHAPFALDARHANTLVVLPERTYAVDCEVYEIPPEEQIAIEMPPLFADLVNLDDRAVQKTLREVTAKDLALALNGAGGPETEKAFANVSGRSAEMLRDEMDIMGDVSTFEIEEARSRIAWVIRRLAETGEIAIRRTGAD